MVEYLPQAKFLHHYLMAAAIIEKRYLTAGRLKERLRCSKAANVRIEHGFSLPGLEALPPFRHPPPVRQISPHVSRPVAPCKRSSSTVASEGHNVMEINQQINNRLAINCSSFFHVARGLYIADYDWSVHHSYFLI